MRFVFRADASIAIGAGHVMRDSAIAEEVISRGLPAIFVGEIDNIPWLTERVQDLGFDEIYQDSGSFCSNPETDVLILDSYLISESDKFIQMENWLAVINIFDGFTPNYQSTIRIHPGIEDNWEQIPGTPALSGTKFIPLRNGIYNNKKVINSQLRITITGGGSDSNDFVGAVSEVLTTSKEDFWATIFTDRTLLPSLDNRFQVKAIGKEFDAVMACTDLAFTTASTTCLEFLATGSVVAIGCSIQNQETNYMKLGQLGIVSQIGKYIEGSWQLDANLILEIASSESLRSNLSEKAKNFIDLNGAARIVDEIIHSILEPQLEDLKIKDGN